MDQARLRALLNYDPESGLFTRLVERGGEGIGKIAGYVRADGYQVICVDDVRYRAGRVAWLYMTGAWPVNQIDHKNGVRSDDRWGNLRDVPQSLNQQNQRRPNKGNKSGFLGVSQNGSGFRADIRLRGKIHYLGTFKTASLAHATYLKAKREMHAGCLI